MRTVSTMGFAGAAVLSFCFPDYAVFRFSEAIVWAIALLGLVVLCGVSGQFSFAQAALYGMGGYTAALLSNHSTLSVHWAMLLAPLVGYGAGWGLGRIAGGHSIWTQALMSYALAIAFPQLLRWRLIEDFTGGVQGLYIDAPTAPFGLVSNDRWCFFLALAALAVTAWATANLTRGRSGRALAAARDHDLAAWAQGIDVVRVRAIASGVAGAWIALAGCLSAFQFGFVGPTSYNLGLSLQMLFGLVVGGMNSIAGAIVGGLLLEYLPGWVAGLGKGLSGLLFAALMVAAIVAMPTGIAGAVSTLLDRARLARRPKEVSSL